MTATIAAKKNVVMELPNPPDTLMTAANLGTEDAILIDTFNLPVGVPAITIREPGYPGS